MYTITPWDATIALKQSADELSKNFPLPESHVKIAAYTTDYENFIRELWDRFKMDPTREHALEFIDAMVGASDEIWEEFFRAVIGIEDEFLPKEHQRLLDEEIAKHKDYLLNSLYPDLLKGIEQNVLDFSNLDARVIMMYAGALWSFGMLATVMFDGLSLRDLADVFIFAGPDDEATCKGDRGCEQYANKFYTVAQILAQDIIPGHLKCLTNCRHMLIPVFSPLKEITIKGGAGSGNWGHAGRQGKRGGSAPASSAGGAPVMPDDEWMEMLSGGQVAELRQWSQDNFGHPDVVPMMRQAYNFTDPESGFTSRIRSVKLLKNGSIALDGRIYGPDMKTEIGTYMRVLYPDGTVEHKAFGLLSEHQSKGYGVKFFKRTEDAYQKAGFKRIKLDANASVGGYAWARMGFNFDRADERNDVAFRVNQTWQKLNGVSAPSDVLDGIKVGAISAWELAVVVDNNGNRVGKQAMLGSMWHGSKELNTTSDGYQAGQAYYESRGL